MQDKQVNFPEPVHIVAYFFQGFGCTVEYHPASTPRFAELIATFEGEEYSTRWFCVVSVDGATQEMGNAIARANQVGAKRGAMVCKGNGMDGVKPFVRVSGVPVVTLENAEDELYPPFRTTAWLIQMERVRYLLTKLQGAKAILEDAGKEERKDLQHAIKILLAVRRALESWIDGSPSPGIPHWYDKTLRCEPSSSEWMELRCISILLDTTVSRTAEDLDRAAALKG